MGFFSRVRRGAAVVVVPLVLVACGDDSPAPSPSVSDPVTVSPSPTATGPVAPVLPDLAKEKSAPGAEEFIRHYWRVVDYAQATGDTGALKELSSDKCLPCQAGIDGVTKLRDAGGVIKMKPHRVRVKVPTTEMADGSVILAVPTTVKVPGGETFYAPGDPRNEVLPARTDRYDITLSWVDGDARWVLENLDAR